MAAGLQRFYLRRMKTASPGLLRCWWPSVSDVPVFFLQNEREDIFGGLATSQALCGDVLRPSQEVFRRMRVNQKRK